ncbi:hypothetical protein MF545_12705 [Stenotrophomonas maltophilia]|nr:hypothetical protein [Stenotrophomonas maltophilia]
MNKQRRNRLRDLDNRLESLIADFEQILEAETEAFDNMPENLQASERGDAMQATNDSLTALVDYLQDARTELSEVIGG